MALQTLKSVKLTNSRAIKKGISNKNVGVLSDELKKQQRKGKEYRFLDEGRIKNNQVLEKTIHAYRMYFLFLKLGLELEEQNATLILKQDRYTIVNRYRPSQKRVKIADRMLIVAAARLCTVLLVLFRVLLVFILTFTSLCIWESL